MKRIVLLTILLITSLGLALSQAWQPTPITTVQAGDGPLFDFDTLVVRAYFDNPDMVAELAQWKEPWEVNRDKGYVVVDVTADEYQQLLDAGFRLELDEALTLQINQPLVALPGQVNGIPGYPCYRTVEETYATAQSIVANYPTLATWTDIGDSWQKTQGSGGYDMMVLRLTNSAILGPKPKIFIMSAIHAREYTTAELNTRFAEYLVQNYDVDADVTWLLDYHEIHLLLQSNPDGRKQAEAGNLWRKNINNNYCSNTSSRGADLNRNFEFQWGCCGGSSSSQCSETYRGPSPASEPEVQAVQDYVRANFPDQRDDPITAAAPITATGVFMDIHSYSQLVLWPWGFTNTQAGNSTALQTLGRKFAYFNHYDPEQAIGLYPTDGTTDDFAYGELGVAAYTIELGTEFFESCSSFEGDTLPKNMPALFYAAKVARTPYMTPAGPDVVDMTLSPGAVAPGTIITLTSTADDTRSFDNIGSEPAQNITAAEYYIDIPPWITDTTPIAYPLSAADGSFNSTIEVVTGAVDTTGLASGRHIVFTRAQDANGNWGPVTARFLYIIDPLVAPTISGHVIAADTGQPLAATVYAGTLTQVDTDPVTGAYQMQVISGTYDLTADPVSSAYAPATVTNVAAQNYQTIQQDFHLYPYCDTLVDDVESGNTGWSSQTPWAITTEASHSPSHSWTDSPGSDYNNYRDVSLTSPVLDLSEYTGTVLNFWQICDTEAGYDYCRVEVSTNGINWTQVASYDGAHTQWEQINLSLPQLDNQANARFRFRLTSDGGITADGWHVDDIHLIGAGIACAPQVIPTAAFTATNPTALGEPTIFTNTSTGTEPSYAWDFGDGTAVVTDTNPVHIYGATGTYTAVLTATNQLGSSTTSQQIQVMLAPQAGFTVVVSGTTAVFTNTSAGTDLTYTWDFGDSTAVNNEANPSHTYVTSGTYTVTLTATNLIGMDSISQPVTIDTIVDPYPIKIFLPVAKKE